MIPSLEIRPASRYSRQQRRLELEACLTFRACQFIILSSSIFHATLKAAFVRRTTRGRDIEGERGREKEREERGKERRDRREGER